jgi:hypothetical protein
MKFYQNRWTEAQPHLARQVQELVSAGYGRPEIAEKLGLTEYKVDRLRGGTEPQGGMPMKTRTSKKPLSRRA